MGDLDQTSLVVWTRLGETPTYDPETYVIPAASGQVNLAYRSAAHQLALQQSPGVVDAARFGEEKAAVSRKWNELLSGAEL